MKSKLLIYFFLTIVIIFLVATIAKACEYIPNPSPSPLPSSEPSIEPSQSPEPSESPSESPSPEPTRQPEVTPAPTEESRPGLTEAGAPHYDCANIEFAPTLLTFERLSPTSVKVTWTKTDPIADYRVFYGLSEDNLVWSVGVEGTHEITLNQLPANQSIWVRVYGTDGRCLGKPSLTIDP